MKYATEADEIRPLWHICDSVKVRRGKQRHLPRADSLTYIYIGAIDAEYLTLTKMHQGPELQDANGGQVQTNRSLKKAAGSS